MGAQRSGATLVLPAQDLPSPRPPTLPALATAQVPYPTCSLALLLTPPSQRILPLEFSIGLGSGAVGALPTPLTI